MRRVVTLAVLVAAVLIAPSAQGVPAAGPGYVASFQVSYDSPPFPDARYRVTISLTGDVCTDPFVNTWGFEGTRTGGPSTPPPTLSPVTFAAANPVNLTGDRWFDASGAEIARIEIILRFNPGSPPTLTPSWTTTGDIVNVVATPTLVPVTAQTLADCSAAQQPPPPPPLSTPSGTVSGKVLVNGRQYRSGGPIPFGSRVNVTDGRLTLRTELGTVTVYGGGVPALFKLVRVRKPADLVELQLVDGNFKACRKRALAGASQSAKPVRRLWAKGTGKFRTKGRYGSATVRGTWWLTADFCDRTLVQVREGSMLVRDFPKQKTVVVKAPSSYRALKPRR